MQEAQVKTPDLSEKEKDTLRVVRDMVRAKYRFSTLYLYGSRAKGKAKAAAYTKKAGRGGKVVELERSDYDVCVFLASRGHCNRQDPELQEAIRARTGEAVSLVFCAQMNEFCLLNFELLNL